MDAVFKYFLLVECEKTCENLFTTGLDVGIYSFKFTVIGNVLFLWWFRGAGLDCSEHLPPVVFNMVSFDANMYIYFFVCPTCPAIKYIEKDM